MLNLVKKMLCVACFGMSVATLNAATLDDHDNAKKDAAAAKKEKIAELAKVGKYDIIELNTFYNPNLGDDDITKAKVFPLKSDIDSKKKDLIMKALYFKNKQDVAYDKFEKKYNISQLNPGSIGHVIPDYGNLKLKATQLELIKTGPSYKWDYPESCNKILEDGEQYSKPDYFKTHEDECFFELVYAISQCSKDCVVPSKYFREKRDFKALAANRLQFIKWLKEINFYKYVRTLEIRDDESSEYALEVISKSVKEIQEANK